MLTLAVATSGELCSVAVADATGIVAERSFRHRMRLSERLMADVDAVLGDADTTLAAIEALGVDIGPGSFTGVRIGVTTGKTWADVLGKPVAGISALEAVAAEQAASDGDLAIAAIRARPDAVYVQAFERRKGSVYAACAVSMMAPDGVASLLAACDARSGVRCIVCGDGLALHRAKLVASLQEAGMTVAIGSAEAPRAVTIARLAADRVATGRIDDSLALVPLYVAPPPLGQPKPVLRSGTSG